MSDHLPRIGSAVLVVDRIGNVLLGERAKDPGRGQWVIPGGKIDPFESIEQAGRRELWQECHVEIEISSTRLVRELIDRRIDQHRIIVYSLGRLKDNWESSMCVPGDDTSNLLWASFQKAEEMNAAGLVSDFIYEVMNDLWFRPKYQRL